MNIKKIEAIIRPFKLDEVLDILRDVVDGMTVSEVSGGSSPADAARTYRGAQYSADALNVKLEIVTTRADVDAIVRTIFTAARTGQIGDGHIFVYDVCDVIRIRNAQCGEAAL